MTQVERIRQYVVQRYIEPARQEKLSEVSILTKDIRSGMGLPIKQTILMEALTARIFLNQNGLEIEQGGWQDIRYRLSRTDHSPDKGSSSQRGSNAKIVFGIQPGHEQADDWRKRVLELPIGEFQGLVGEYLKANGYSDSEVGMVIRAIGQR